MTYTIRSYSSTLKCRIGADIAKNIFNASIGHFRPHRSSLGNVYQIDKETEFKISPRFTLHLDVGDLIYSGDRL